MTAPERRGRRAGVSGADTGRAAARTASMVATAASSAALAESWPRSRSICQNGAL